MTNLNIESITNGILTSIIASFLFFIYTKLVDSSNEEIESKIKEIESKISAVTEYLDISPSNLKEKIGIIKIEHRKEYSYELWDFL